jgi:hypothetical protein
MSDIKQTDAMADILRKLNEGVDVSNPSSKASRTNAMAEVLRKLQNVTKNTVTTVVTEGMDKPDFNVAVNTTRTKSGVSISRYDIQTEKKLVQEGLKKTFYRIIDNRTDKLIYEDLGLFESAMGIVKHMLYTHNTQRIERLIELDQEYVGAIMETYGYKQRMRRLNESSVQYDVAAAKYSKSRTKMATTKMKILKAL